MGCTASKAVLSSTNAESSRDIERRGSFSVSSKSNSNETTLPNYWEARTSIKISKEGKENINNVAQQLGI
jgi:hypothetical protein